MTFPSPGPITSPDTVAWALHELWPPLPQYDPDDILSDWTADQHDELGVLACADMGIEVIRVDEPPLYVGTDHGMTEFGDHEVHVPEPG